MERKLQYENRRELDEENDEMYYEKENEIGWNNDEKQDEHLNGIETMKKKMKKKKIEDFDEN